MIESAGIEYTQARIQARLGQHPHEVQWQRIEAARSLAAALAAARDIAFFSTWTAGLSPASNAHAIELGLHTRLRKLVIEISDWMPVEWREASLWVRVLPDLPILFRLYQDETPPAWMRGDRALDDLLDPDLVRRRQSIRSGRLAPLAQHWENADELRHAWVAEWRQRWPRDEDNYDLDKLVAVIQRHLGAFPEAAPESAWDARVALRATLRLMLHRTVLRPAGAFYYLALAALDVERLRAQLVRCALFFVAEAA